MRRMRIMGVLAAAASLALPACACRSAPRDSDARSWYKQHILTINAIDKKIRDEVALIPRFSNKPFVCDPAAAKAARESEKAKAGEEITCAYQRLSWLNDSTKAARRFNEEVLPKFLRRAGVIGVSVTYELPGAEGKNLLGRTGLAPGGLIEGTVRAAHGISVDDRMLGWGLYQTAYQLAGGLRLGDDKRRPGIEVAWSFQQASATFNAQLFILAGDLTSREWQAGWKSITP